ncbi:MFS transporter [Saccharothrix mutabilis subsp. mutabilis]|uniref:MFS transporter n=1 Tax=Saccharothrix mutabilis subsp. mutabilis TaxID=66855 RepID=A0ABN0TZP9_9PSEU
MKLAKIIAVSSSGSAIEWYDFFIYGTAAALIFNKLFFPTADPLAGTLLAFSTFAVGFAARPLGGMVFGHLGDKVGRKAALVTALFLMGGSTTLIGLLPTYASIGVLAPIALVVLRLAQGVAVGGQWGGAVLIATENAPPHRRGLYGSFAQLGVPVGLVLSTLVFLGTSAWLTEAQFAAWGWRLPFLFSIALIMVALYAQFRLEETVAMREVKATGTASSPVLEVLRRHPGNIALAAGAVVVVGAGFYLFATYLLSYGTTVLGMPRSTMLNAVMWGAVAQVPALLAFAHLSDRIGRRPVYLFGAVTTGLWVFPAFLLVNTRSPGLVVLAVVVALVLFAAMYGPQAAFFSELFTARLRYSGASLGYQVGVMLGGAFTPIIATWLYSQYRTFVPVAVFLLVTALVSCACVVRLTAAGRAELVPQPA